MKNKNGNQVNLSGEPDVRGGGDKGTRGQGDKGKDQYSPPINGFKPPTTVV